MPNAGYWETRCAMAKKVSEEQGVSITGDQVVMSVGAAGALNVVFKAILSAGDEVIVPAYTYTASASVVAHVGATIKLVDVGADSYHIDYDKLEELITDKTKAIIPVDIAGVMVDYDIIRNIVEKTR